MDGLCLFSADYDLKSIEAEPCLALTTLDAVELDFSDDGAGFMDVWCLQVCVFHELTSRGPSGLIVPRNDATTFRRVGTFAFCDWVVPREERNGLFFTKLATKQQEWSRSCEMKEIIICRRSLSRDGSEFLEHSPLIHSLFHTIIQVFISFHISLWFS
jgi:hypothetical protein